MPKTTKAELEVKNNALNVEIEKLTSRIETLVTWGRGFASKYNWLVADANKRIFTLEKRLQKATECWHEQRAEITALKADLSAAQARIAELEAQISGNTTAA